MHSYMCFQNGKKNLKTFQIWVFFFFTKMLGVADGTALDMVLRSLKSNSKLCSLMIDRATAMITLFINNISFAQKSFFVKY